MFSGSIWLVRLHMPSLTVDKISSQTLSFFIAVELTEQFPVHFYFYYDVIFNKEKYM